MLSELIANRFEVSLVRPANELSRHCRVQSIGFSAPRVAFVAADRLDGKEAADLRDAARFERGTVAPERFAEAVWSLEGLSLSSGGWRSADERGDEGPDDASFGNPGPPTCGPGASRL